MTRLAAAYPTCRSRRAPPASFGVYDVTDDWIPVYDRTSLRGYYVAIGTSGNQFKNAPVIGQLMAAIITQCEAGRDHDADPVVWRAPHTRLDVDLSHYSRLRTPHASSGTVMGWTKPVTWTAGVAGEAERTQRRGRRPGADELGHVRAGDRGERDPQRGVASREERVAGTGHAVEHGQPVRAQRPHPGPFLTDVGPVRGRKKGPGGPHERGDAPLVEPTVQAGELDRPGQPEPPGHRRRADPGLDEVHRRGGQLRAADRHAVALPGRHRQPGAQLACDRHREGARRDDHAAGRDLVLAVIAAARSGRASPVLASTALACAARTVLASTGLARTAPAQDGGGRPGRRGRRSPAPPRRSGWCRHG